MYCKIALNNVRKSLKDYAIYFITLTLAVSIFYSFNSVSSQKAMLEVSSAQVSFMLVFQNIMSLVSVFISFILGGLILYASNFLIKKRKKELGLYSILGMGKRKISRILVFETFIVGLFSLLSGLILGLIFSQGLSVITSKLFEMDMSEFTFIISKDAMLKTIIYFGIIFIIVMIFNVFVISRYKIIDLLSAGKKNEEIKIRNPYVYLITFILSVVSLGVAYAMVIASGLDFTKLYFKLSIVLGVTGTILFFFSLTGLSTYVIKRNKGIYFKGLNMFVIRQINNKINTNFISISIICLMLFITMGALSTGISMKETLDSNIKKTTPVDASFRREINMAKNKPTKEFEEILNELGVKLDKENTNIKFNDYLIPESIKEIFKNGDHGLKAGWEGEINPLAIKLSDYNKTLSAIGKNKIDLEDNEAYVVCNATDIVDMLNDYLDDESTVNLFNKKFIIKNKKITEEGICTEGSQRRDILLVVNDEHTKGLQERNNYINIMYPKDKKIEKEKELFHAIEKVGEEKVEEIKDRENNDSIEFITKALVHKLNKGLSTMILFITVYLGIIFLISSMAMLAIQQLSEANDSIERYQSLKRLGANEKRINRTIFMQILIYFSLPIFLAFIHSIVGVKVVNDYILSFNKPEAGSVSILVAVIFLFVYVCYFIATYIGYKNTVREKL